MSSQDFDEHENFNPPCPYCGQRECETHLLLDVETGGEVLTRVLLDEVPHLIARLIAESERVAANDGDNDIDGPDSLNDLIDAAIERVDEGETDPESFTFNISWYLLETARSIKECTVETHVFDGGCPGTGIELLRLYAQDRTSAVRAISAAVESDLALLARLK